MSRQPDYLIRSIDSLYGTKINPNVSGQWRNVPPIPQKKKLKWMCRRSISPILRSSVWMVSIIRNSNLFDDDSNPDEFGSLKKVQYLELSWRAALEQAIPNLTDEDFSNFPRFGVSTLNMKEVLLCPNYNADDDQDYIDPSMIGSCRDALKRVLITLNHITGVECCYLIPDIAIILLSHMPESHAFYALREIINNVDNNGDNRYVQVTRMNHYVSCKTFCDLFKKLHPKLAKKLDKFGVLSVRGVDPIFKRFFAQILKRKHILRLMDIYVIDGYKSLIRFGISLIVMFDSEVSYEEEKIINALSYWNEVSVFVRSRYFSFDKLVANMYGTRKIGFRQISISLFPNRNRIASVMKSNENWANSLEFPTYTTSSNNNLEKEHLNPISFVDHGTNNDIQCMLITPHNFRINLRTWLPDILKHTTKLDLIYSTNYHGRTLESLYNKCSKNKYTLTLIQVIETGGVIGFFVSRPWKRNLADCSGECFLFSLSPIAGCYKWKYLEKSEQITMIGQDDYLGMGLNKNGSCGFRMNEDLTEGESYSSEIFGNVPLAGDDVKEFEIGIVEVYQFLRIADEKPAGGLQENLWNIA